MRVKQRLPDPVSLVSFSVPMKNSFPKRLFRPLLPVFKAAVYLSLLYLLRPLGDIRPIPALLFLLAADLLQSAVHETGHLLGGLLTGHRFLSWQWLFLHISKNGNGCLTGSLRPPGRNQCLMIPSDSRFLLYNLGGILVNFILSVTGCVLWPRFASLSLLALIYAGFFKAAANLLPLRDPPTDFMNCLILMKSRTETNNYLIYMKTCEKIVLYGAPGPFPEEAEKNGYYYGKILSLYDGNSDRNA